MAGPIRGTRGRKALFFPAHGNRDTSSETTRKLTRQYKVARENSWRASSGASARSGSNEGEGNGPQSESSTYTIELTIAAAATGIADFGAFNHVWFGYTVMIATKEETGWGAVLETPFGQLRAPRTANTYENATADADVVGVDFTWTPNLSGGNLRLSITNNEAVTMTVQLLVLGRL